jgi:hypothetical protein
LDLSKEVVRQEHKNKGAEGAVPSVGGASFIIVRVAYLPIEAHEKM